MELRAQMFELVEQYEQSGKSQKQFCQAAGIGLAKLNYWIREYRNRRQPPAGFIRIDAPPANQPPELEVCYPNGVRLKASGADLSLVSQLIRLY
jgi:transposase-like protein